jgi:hypothetical protein
MVERSRDDEVLVMASDGLCALRRFVVLLLLLLLLQVSAVWFRSRWWKGIGPLPLKRMIDSLVNQLIDCRRC